MEESLGRRRDLLPLPIVPRLSVYLKLPVDGKAWEHATALQAVLAEKKEDAIFDGTASSSAGAKHKGRREARELVRFVKACWEVLVIMGLNFLWCGMRLKELGFPRHDLPNAAHQAALQHIEESVNYFVEEMEPGVHVAPRTPAESWEDRLPRMSVNYHGEISMKAQMMRSAQVLPGFPPSWPWRCGGP